LDLEGLYKNIEKIKIAYFSDISRAMADDVLRSIGILNLEESPIETYDVTTKDIILLKEAISAVMCRIVGIDHPLHELAEENIFLTQDDEEVCSYRFKDEPDTASNDF
jgi:hypothetical protein